MRFGPAARQISVVFLILAFACGCSSRHQVERAQRLEDQGRYAEAAALYKQLVFHYRRQPQKESLLQARLGEVLLRADHVQEAFSSFERAAELDRSNVLAHLRLAQLFLAANTADKAHEHLGIVLEQQPNHPDAVAALGAYYVSTGELGKAEREFQKALALQPQRQSTAVALADLYSSAGEIGKARQVLLQSAETNKTEPLALLALGRLEEEQGNAEAAESAYRKAVATEDGPETNLRLAQHLLRAAKVREAQEILGRLDRRKPLESASLADFELSSGHGVPAAMRYLSALHGRLALPHDRNSQQTAAFVARVIEADLDAAKQLPAANSSQSDTRTALARTHLDAYRGRLDPTTLAILEAEIALAEGDIATATLKAEAAVSSGPDSAAASFVLGEVRGTRGDEAGAVAQWNAALNKDPEYTPALLAVAQAEYAAAQYPAAEQKAAAVVRHEPANLAALLVYARVLAAEGDTTAARSIAMRALAINRQSAEPHVVLGEIEMKQQRPGLALLWFQQAIILNPYSKAALDGLIAVYRRGVMKPGMIAKLEHSADAPPRSSALMDIAGRLYSDRRMYNDAARCFKRALEIDRQHATAITALAENAEAQREDYALGQLESLTGKLGGSADALLQAMKAQDENHVEQAVANYEAALRRGESTGVAANNLAWIYAQNGQNLERALELARDARDHDPKNPAVMDTLGFVYLSRREYSQAVNVLKQAILLADSKQRSTDSKTQNSLRRHLSQAYLLSGERNPAE